MSLFIESIQVKDGQCFNLPWHQRRMHKTRRDLCCQSDEIALQDVIRVPPAYDKGLVKCRVVYGEKIHHIDFVPYTLPSIHSLRIIHDDLLDYAYKSADRSALESHYQTRGKADDMLLVKNGCLTDTFFCNVVLRQRDAYFTPDTFLLNGIKRQQLLREEIITERRITVNDLKDFDSIHLINAMIDLGDGVYVAMDQVF